MPTAQAYRTPALTLLDGLFRTAVEAAHPGRCLPGHLPPPPAKGRLIILAAGKAAGSMTEVAERHYLDEMKLPAGRARRDCGRPATATRGRPAGSK